MFLRKFKPYTPPGWAKQTDAVKPATPLTAPAATMSRPMLPPTAPVGPDRWRTVDDVPQWATPTQDENPQVQDDE